MYQLDFIEGIFANNLINNDIEEENLNQEISSNEDSPTSLVIKPDKLDISIIPEYPNTAFIITFTPSNFKEYIGQEKAKKLIKMGVDRYLKLGESVHFLLLGSKGHGKTTLSKIIANMLGGEYIYRTGSQLENLELLANTFRECYFAKKYPVLFIDEIHTLRPNIIEEYFYSAMEYFQIQGKSIRPFSLIGATTEGDYLISRLPPFIDRFNIVVNLEKYTEDDIFKILKQYQDKFLGMKLNRFRELIRESRNLEKKDIDFKDYKVKMFFDLLDKYKSDFEVCSLVNKLMRKFNKNIFDLAFEEIAFDEIARELFSLLVKKFWKEEKEKHIIKPLKDDVLRIIAKNSRLTPRIAINLLKNSLLYPVEEVLKANRIIYNGLTDIDFKILLHLIEIGKPVGEEALALSVGLTRKQYKMIYEPYLVSEGYISRTARGRVITEKGKKILEKIAK